MNRRPLDPQSSALTKLRHSPCVLRPSDLDLPPRAFLLGGRLAAYPTRRGALFCPRSASTRSSTSFPPSSRRPGRRSRAGCVPRAGGARLGGDRVGDRDPARSWAPRGPRPRERRPSAFGLRGRAPSVALRAGGPSSPGTGGVRPCGETATRVRGAARRRPAEGRWRHLRRVHVARRGRVEEVTQA